MDDNIPDELDDGLEEDTLDFPEDLDEQFKPADNESDLFNGDFSDWN